MNDWFKYSPWKASAVCLKIMHTNILHSFKIFYKEYLMSLLKTKKNSNNLICKDNSQTKNTLHVSDNTNNSWLVNLSDCIPL